MAASLWPREHGVYAQVSLPLLTSLLISPTLAGALISLTVVMAFLLHEPLQVLTGGRGKRAKMELASTAITRIKMLALGVLAAGAGGFFLAPFPARIALIPLVASGLITLIIVWRYTAKMILAELLVALTFSLALLPVALAGHEPAPLLWMTVGIWATVFGSQTLAVHAVKARGGLIAYITSAIGAALLLVAILGAKLIYPVLGALTGPALVLIVVMAARTGPKRLRLVGWAFACADSTTLILILLSWPS